MADRTVRKIMAHIRLSHNFSDKPIVEQLPELFEELRDAMIREGREEEINW